MAARHALTNGLLARSPADARRVLLSLRAPPDLALVEVSEVIDLLTRAMSPDAAMAVGVNVDPSNKGEEFGEDFRVTVFAAP
jgi:cell division GTPase FtsZ